MADLVVDFTASDAAEADLLSTADRLRALAVDLAAGLGPLTVTWTGSAAEAYAEQQRRWDAAARDLVAVLEELRARIVAARANHHAAVRANHAIWTP